MTPPMPLESGMTLDLFGNRSHLTPQPPHQNRMIPREAVQAHSFKPIAEELRHFTLKNEPHPDTSFTFPGHEASVTGRK